MSLESPFFTYIQEFRYRPPPLYSEVSLGVQEGPIPFRALGPEMGVGAVSYTHLTLPTIHVLCRSRWSPYH